MQLEVIKSSCGNPRVDAGRCEGTCLVWSQTRVPAHCLIEEKLGGLYKEHSLSGQIWICTWHLWGVGCKRLLSWYSKREHLADHFVWLFCVFPTAERVYYTPKNTILWWKMGTKLQFKVEFHFVGKLVFPSESWVQIVILPQSLTE